MKRPNFPATTYEDNVRLQYALCQALGVKKLAAYIGFSMGGQQAYHMATIYPEFVERAVVIASSARTPWQNWCFLEGPKAALVNSADWHDGHYTMPVEKPGGYEGLLQGLRDLVFQPDVVPWAMLGTEGLQSPGGFSGGRVPRWSGKGLDAHDMLCMMHIWQKGDI